MDKIYFQQFSTAMKKSNIFSQCVEFTFKQYLKSGIGMLCQLMDGAVGIAGVGYGSCLIEATEGGGAVAHVTIGESQYIVGQHMLAA